MLTQTVGNRTYDYFSNVGVRDTGLAVGVAVGDTNSVYILARQHEQIADVSWDKTAVHAKVNKYFIGTTAGDEERDIEFGGYGSEPGSLIWPAGIALDREENVYVTDEWMNRISVFSSTGELLKVWGSEGTGSGQFNRPAGIAIDSDENVYVVDSLNHRVQKLTKDGECLTLFGEYGRQVGQFDSPWGIAVDKNGYIYVADHKNHRVQKLDPDGLCVASFGSYGTGDQELNRPSDVTIDPEGDVYICDWANNRVQIYEQEGEFIASLIGDAQTPSKWNQQAINSNIDVVKARRRVASLEPEWRLAFPVSVEFDETNSRIIIADSQRWRVQIYNKMLDYIEPQANL